MTVPSVESRNKEISRILKTSNHYDVLEVPRKAENAEIKRAYRKLSLIVHPDRNKDNSEATGAFQKVNQAHDTLTDSKKRLDYDSGGSRRVQPVRFHFETSPYQMQSSFPFAQFDDDLVNMFSQSFDRQGPRETFHFSNGHFYRVRQNPSPYRNYHRHPQYRRQPTQRQHPANYYREDVQNEICNNAFNLPLILAFLMLFVINIGYNLFSSSEKLYSLQRTQKFNQMHYIEEIDTYFYTKSGKKLSDKKLRAIRSEITKSYIKNLYDKCYNGRIELQRKIRAATFKNRAADVQKLKQIKIPECERLKKLNYISA